MVNASKKAGLGNTIGRASKVVGKKRNPRTSKLHTTDTEPDQLNLRSCTDQTNLDQFLEEATLAGKQFITERRNMTIINEKDDCEPVEIEDNEQFNDKLSVPRRPIWDSSTTPEQLDEMERQSFLKWRKGLAKLQESDGVYMTPFEKNIEVWRQLWRVIERSDIVVQILDCRNPLLYLCEDLIQYVEESGKKNLVLLNKADFLTIEQRRIWFQYFNSRNIKTLFFSALIEKDNESNYDENGDKEPEEEENTRLYNKFQLLDAWRAMKSGLLTVGLVGYPNVGKSSTINALLSAKRVAVSATPGKTKHFQTFLVDEDMILCDCPGLVFPNFVSNKSEMVINGILPIDQMHDYIGPVRLIVNRIPKAFFEHLYGLAFDQDDQQNLCAEDLLNALGFMRGYMTARGLPDISRASRKICKDYINGKILYSQPPPEFDKSVYLSHSKMASAIQRFQAKDPALALQITQRQRRLMAQAKGTDITDGEFNTLFFQKLSMGVHVKGLPNIGNMVRPVGDCQIEKSGAKVAPTREKKFKKREKLRRVYRHLDV